MSWLGIGLGSESRIPRAGQGLLQPPPLLAPGAAWTSLASSGFTHLPVDSIRSTAKPALHLLTPPRRFTGTLDVGALAMANHGGSLADTLGVEKVIFYYEGSTVEVTAPSWHAIETRRGPRLYFGWWARLRKRSGGPMNGSADLYIEAVPRDQTMQNRVIGPFFFDPVDLLYTHSVTVAASQPQVSGERYPTIDAAIAYLNSLAPASSNPLITITEPGLYDITRSTGTLMTGARGYLNITARVPGVVIGKASYVDDQSARLRDGRYKLHLFGQGLGVDMRRITEIDGSTADLGSNHWLDGITITTSGPDGRATLIRGNTPARSTAVRSFPYATEVDFIEVRNPSRNFKLVRGCRYQQIGADVANETRCFVFNTLDTQTNKPLNNEVDAFTVRYTGPEAVATLAFPGGTHASGGGVFTLTLGGTVRTFDVGSAGNNEAYFLGTATYRGASGVGGYWHQDVIDWLNSVPGVTATRQIAQDRCASFSTLPGTVAVGWNAVSIKDTTLQVASVINSHGDFYQHNAGVLENIIIAFNDGRNLDGQIFFFSPSDVGGLAAERDVFVVGNAMGQGIEGSTYYDPATASSQFGRGDGLEASHVVIAHNTMPNQGWFIRTVGVVNGFTADRYCTFRNNVARRFQYDGESLPLANLTVDGLLIHANELVPPGSRNVIRAGDRNSIVANFAAGDFRPAGPLLTSGLAPAIPTDLTRGAFHEISPLGAFATPASPYAAPALSTTPEADLLAAFNAVSGGQSFFLDFRRATLVSGTLTVPDQSANGNHALQSTSTNRPALSFNGAFFTGSDFVTVPICGGVFTLILAFNKDDASTSGSVASDQDLDNKGVNYQDATISAPGFNIFVNGEPVGTRDRFHDLLHRAGEVIVSIEDLDFTGDSELRIGRPSGALTGEVRRVIAIDQAAFADRLPLIRSLALQVAGVGYQAPPTPDPNANIIDLVNAAGGQSGVYQMSLGTVVGGTLLVPDRSNNGRNLTQADSARRPIIGSAGATFAADDWLGLTVSGGTFTVVLSLTKASASVTGNVISDQAAASGISHYNSTATNTLSTSNRVNGAVVTTRQALYNAMHATGEVVLTIEAIDASGDTQLRLGRGATGGFEGVIRRAVILDHDAHLAGLAQAIAAAQAWVRAA